MDAPAKIPVFFGCHFEGDHASPNAIEWAHATADHSEIVSAFHLVQPVSEGRSPVDDDRCAANPRRITFAELKKHGEAPTWVAERMNQVLQARELFSIAPHDGEHLLRLFHAADAQPEFELRQVFAQALIADLARVKRMPRAKFAQLKRKAELRTSNSWPSSAAAQTCALLWADVADAG